MRIYKASISTISTWSEKSCCRRICRRRRCVNISRWVLKLWWRYRVMEWERVGNVKWTRINKKKTEMKRESYLFTKKWRVTLLPARSAVLAADSRSDQLHKYTKTIYDNTNKQSENKLKLNRNYIYTLKKEKNGCVP